MCVCAHIRKRTANLVKAVVPKLGGKYEQVTLAIGYSFEYSCAYLAGADIRI